MINCNLKRNRYKSHCKKKAVGEAEFKVILPKRDNSGRKINIKIHKRYIDRMNKRFGGTTTKPQVLGCFKDPKSKNQFQCEQNIVIEAVRDFDSSIKLKNLSAGKRAKKLKEDFSFVKRLAKDAGKQFGQESIMIQFDRIADATFVGGKRKKRLSEDKIFDDVFAREV